MGVCSVLGLIVLAGVAAVLMVAKLLDRAKKEIDELKINADRL